MPYEKWECISKNCTKLLKNSVDKNHFYSQKTICNSDLKIEEDFIFADDNRTSFAVEWGLFCEGEAQMSFLSSSIFLGSIIRHNLLHYTFQSLQTGAHIKAQRTLILQESASKTVNLVVPLLFRTVNE